MSNLSLHRATWLSHVELDTLEPIERLDSTTFGQVTTSLVSAESKAPDWERPRIPAAHRITSHKA